MERKQRKLWTWNPVTKRRIDRFKENKTALWSLRLLSLLFVLSLFSEFIANNTPILMKYHGRYYLPVVTSPKAQDLGIEGVYEIDYRTLEFKDGDFAVYTPIKFNPVESNMKVEMFPSPPSSENWMGTDDRGRDIAARLLYGFRISFFFAMAVWIITYFVGTILGLCMGFFGGWIDFAGQRIVEVLSTVPQFFLLIILISIFDPSMMLLVFISALFGWISISYYIRAEGLKLRKLEFVEAARALGQPTYKIIIKHVLPNSLTPLVTFSPFAIAGHITGLAALDYLGLGLAPPTPSWGEMLNQAVKNFTVAWWLAVFPSLALFGTLVLLNFVGEGLRNAFDPRAS